MSDRDVCIVGYGRTPMGGFTGTLSSLGTIALGARAVKGRFTHCLGAGSHSFWPGVIEKISLEPNEIDALYMGAVYIGGLGQHPAKQVAVAAGLPSKVNCTCVDKVCASGMKGLVFLSTFPNYWFFSL